MGEFERIFWIVLDSVGIGELPDAAEYGDLGRNTLGHIAESRPLEIPNLVHLGLANIAPLKHQTPAVAPIGAYGKRSEEHTSELQSRLHLVCRLLLEKNNVI